MKKLIYTLIFNFFILLFFSISSYANSPQYLFINANHMLNDIIYQFDQFDYISFQDSSLGEIKNHYATAKTGIIVNCVDNHDVTTSYRLVVRGDVNADGNIDDKDIYLIKANLVGLIDLKDEYLKACDRDENETISLSDLLANKKEIKKDSMPTENDIEISEITLNTTKLDLEVGESATLQYSLSPDNATDKDITYTSSNNLVATVNQEGVVTAISNGTTKISAIASNGISCECTITVHTTPQKLVLNKNKLDLATNNDSSYKLNTIYTPETSNIMTNTVWNSSNSNIVSVDADGSLHALSNGTATITATSENNLTACCEVTVYTLPTNINIPQNIAIEYGKSMKLDVSISPTNANIFDTIYWKSDKENIAKISDDGTITGINPGTTIITAYTKSGISSNCTVNIYDNIKDISLNSNSATIDLSITDNFQIYANSDTGIDVTNVLNWESTNPDIATIDQYGKILAKQNGSTTIKGTLNEIEKIFTLTVHTSPKSLILNKSTITLTVNDTKSLTCGIVPSTSDISNTITWTSSDTSKVIVNSTGTLQAISPGRAIIQAKSENNVITSCLVIITDIPSEIYFNQKQLLLNTSSTEKLQLILNINIDSLDLDSLSLSCDNEDVISYYYEINDSNEIEVFLTGLQNGSSTITANIGEISTSCNIIVYSDLSTLNLYFQDTIISNQSVKIDLSNNNFFNFSAKLSLDNKLYDISNIINWSSSNETIATINNLGEINALSNGSTVIHATLNDEITSEFTIVVETSPKSISLTTSTINLYINGNNTFSLSPIISPSSSNVKNTFSYTSSNETIASVTQNGIITAHSSGNCTISITTPNNKRTTCTVYVRTLPQQVSIKKTSNYLAKGKSSTLTATITPSYADTSNKITWISSAPNIISVDSYGNITAKAPGTATITAKTENNKTNSTQIIVPNLLASVNTSTLDISTNSTANIIINPTSNNLGNLTYSSSNSSIATIDNYGKITAKQNGNVTITITESNANSQLSFPIRVITSTQSVSLNATNISLHIHNSSYQLVATQSPATVSTKGIIWTTSNPSVATVNNSGIVNRVGVGTAIITAKANDGSNKSNSCTVNVKPEKMVIVGASTVVQLANKRTCSTTKGDFCNINYYEKYAYTLDSDLFFVCLGGTGYTWLAGKTPDCPHTNSGTSGDGQKQLVKILNTYPNAHFTIAFMQGGNDLSRSRSKDDVDKTAVAYSKYYQDLAKKYPQHTFEIFPVTPVDESNASSILATNKYNIENSNNKKRHRFASQLNSLVSGSNIGNLNYAKGFYNDLKSLEEAGTYVCYDGKHFNKKTAKTVLKQILERSNVLSSSGKKK